MSAEQEFAAEIAEDYVRKGWEVRNSEEALASVGFRPNLLLRRGEEYLVVEIKRLGSTPEPKISELRKLVERQPNWHLEVKLLPLNKEHPMQVIAETETPNRLRLIQGLFEERRYSEAVLLAWVVIETSLRKMLARSANGEAAAIPDILRMAYEADFLSDPELRQLHRALTLRNVIVHGYAADIRESEVQPIMMLARALASRTGQTVH
jgi:hypothetical protein